MTVYDALRRRNREAIERKKREEAETLRKRLMEMIHPPLRVRCDES